MTPARAAQILGKLHADILAENFEGRAAVNGESNIVPALGNRAHRTDRIAALRKPGGDLDVGRKQDAGQAAACHRSGDLRFHGLGRG